MKRFLIAVALILIFGVRAASAQAPAQFTKLVNVTALTATDTLCANLSTCFYVVTAVDAAGFESQPGTCDPTVPCVGGTEAIAQMPSSGTHSVAIKWTTQSTITASYNVYVHRGALSPQNLSVIVAQLRLSIERRNRQLARQILERASPVLTARLRDYTWSAILLCASAN
jgi:hypothetical protein